MGVSRHLSGRGLDIFEIRLPLKVEELSEAGPVPE